MKIQTALKDLSYQIIWGEADQEVKEVIYDSRKAEPETVFVCMMGARIDSHDFMQEVAEKGCRLFVVEKEIPEEQLQKLPEGTSVVRVDSAREALAHLSAARFGFPAEKMTCIGDRNQRQNYYDLYDQGNFRGCWQKSRSDRNRRRSDRRSHLSDHEHHTGIL